jgi:hypothetical protein
MSDKGIRGFYQITETIKDTLLVDPNVKSVTIGDITEVDLAKQTIFPLAHIVVNNAVQEERTITFNISVLTMDLVDQSKEETEDLFVGNNNLHDVLNTQLAVINKVIQKLRMGTLYTELYQIDGAVTCEPFLDRFENNIAGWASTFDVMIENDIKIC